MKDATRSKKKRRGGTRRKTGCETCKKRHSRCDEKKPVCGNCERLVLECLPSDYIPPSNWNNTFAPTTSDSTVYPSQPSSLLDISSDTPNQPSSTWEIFQSRLANMEISTNGSSPTDMCDLPLPTPSPSLTDFTTITATNLTPEIAFLLQTYLRTVATWMDLFDYTCTYQLQIPRVMLKSSLLLTCICAFTAKHLSLFSSRSLHSSWDSIARRYYGSALRLLIATLNGPSDEHTLTATILLSSYEILDTLASEQMRKHFLGTRLLIKSHSISAQSSGIALANFWIYVRHEIGVALSTEKPLVLSPEEWNVVWSECEAREDVLGRKCLWILARVINLVYGEESLTSTGKHKRGALLLELEEWRNRLPDTCIGIPYGEKDKNGFRKVYFTVTEAAAAAFWYHVSHILLYAEPVLQDPSYIPLIQEQAIETANIALSEFPDSLRVFATHGLFQAAKHIKGIGKKARIWGILDDVERELGYHTGSIVRRLQALIEKE